MSVMEDVRNATHFRPAGLFLYPPVNPIEW
jgi:hypothetical protein